MKINSIGKENFEAVKNVLEKLGIRNPKGFKVWLCWLFDKDFEVEERKRGGEEIEKKSFLNLRMTFLTIY